MIAIKYPPNLTEWQVIFTKRRGEGAIKSDAGVQGLPCDGAYRQGKPCTPGEISNTAVVVSITFNHAPGANTFANSSISFVSRTLKHDTTNLGF
jgi:hypothetical protein